MNCPVCNKTSFTNWGKTEEHTIVICSECGLGITTPFPSREQLLAANQERYQVNLRIHTYFSRQRYLEKRYRKYIAKIEHFKNGGSLLDVGCNVGLFLKVAREEGFSVKGVELNKASPIYKYVQL
jgi:hypothetical protein